MTFTNKLSLGFAAGAFGTVVWFILFVLMGKLGIGAALGLKMSPPPNMLILLYKQLVWGGIYGFLLILPVLERKWLVRGILLGVLATLVGWFYFIPARGGQTMGLNFGIAFPFISITLNSIWGAAAAWWYKMVTSR